MLSSQFDTFLFKGQLWKGGHPRCERCLVISGCMFAKGGGEISYQWMQMQILTSQKEFLWSEGWRDGIY